jgi:chromosome segregation ATPase
MKRALLLIVLTLLCVGKVFAADLPIPPEIAELESQMKQLERATTIAPEKRTALHSDYTAVKAQFKQVWEPMNTAYKAVIEKTQAHKQKRADLEAQIKAHNDAQPATSDDVNAHRQRSEELNKAAENLDSSWTKERVELKNSLDTHKRTVEAWLIGPAVTQLKKRLVAVGIKTGTAYKQLESAAHGNGQPYFVPPVTKPLENQK